MLADIHRVLQEILLEMSRNHYETSCVLQELTNVSGKHAEAFTAMTDTLNKTEEISRLRFQRIMSSLCNGCACPPSASAAADDSPNLSASASAGATGSSTLRNDDVVIVD